MVNYRRIRKMSDFYNLTQTRLAWFLLLSSLVLVISTALFFQHVKGMEPCYLCIIQRIGVIMAIVGALIGIVKPKNTYIKFTGILTVLIGISVSLYSSIRLVYMQANPPLFSSCGMNAEQLMENYGFLKSLPLLFEGSASCAGSAGSFMFITFEQWTLLVFSIYSLILIPLSVFVVFKTLTKKH